MEGNFFNKDNIHITPKRVQFTLKENPSPIVPIIPTNYQDEYSNNVLNTGFIAQDSKCLLSDSQSVNSEDLSISYISSIRVNSKNNDMVGHNFDEMSVLSYMDEWSQSPQAQYGSQKYKRNKPETIDDEWKQLSSKFTKKKMNERNKVVTISHLVKTKQQPEQMIRRQKEDSYVQQASSSSNQDIREILGNMQTPQESQKIPIKKSRQKP